MIVFARWEPVWRSGTWTLTLKVPATGVSGWSITCPVAWLMHEKLLIGITSPVPVGTSSWVVAMTGTSMSNAPADPQVRLCASAPGRFQSATWQGRPQ